MIKANELRLGNLVLLGKEYVQIESIDDQGVNSSVSGGYYPGETEIEYEGHFEDWSVWSGGKHRVLPIKITIEIVQASGFIHEVHDDTSYYIQAGFWISHVDDDWYLGQEEFKPFQFVHQLQNLYFALTGIELEINLNK